MNYNCYLDARKEIKLSVRFIFIYYLVLSLGRILTYTRIIAVQKICMYYCNCKLQYLMMTPSVGILYIIRVFSKIKMRNQQLV